MKDIDLYQQILGLTAPWFVSKVELDVAGGQVDVFVAHEENVPWSCPHCDYEGACYDHAPERDWRHLDTCQFKTFLHARIPRVKCPEHGVVQAAIPWAGKHSRFTLLMERMAIDVLQACQTVSAACEILRISWDRAWHLMQRAVHRGQSRKKPAIVPLVGVDEKAFKKGHSYMTVVCDIDWATVEYVAEGRKKESLEGYFASLTPEQLGGIEALAMDMWQPYVQATLEWVPLAGHKIVFDRFHVMKYVTEAVDKVRKEEHRELLGLGEETLKKTKYLWLASEENLPERHRERFEQLKKSDLRTARAWAIKEHLRHLWSYLSPGWARRFFKGWYAWAIRSRLKPIQDVAQMLKRRIDNIVTHATHFITNSVAEGLNSKIMAIKRRAGGFRNPENFKTAIYFYCGGLDLYP